MTQTLEASILILDDYSSMPKLLRSFLSKLGFVKILDGHNTEETLEKMHQQHFDLVISNWGTSYIDGVDFLQKVRGFEEFSHIPFIFITDKDETKSNMTEQDFDCIAKPFNVSALKTKLVDILGEF